MFILLLFEPRFLLPFLAPQAWAAAGEAVPVSRHTYYACAASQATSVCLTCTCMLAVCLHGAVCILCAHPVQTNFVNQLGFALVLTFAGLH